MRITCPNCSTQYEVDENDIAFSGQDVQCSECMTIWTQARNGEATNPRSADDLAEDGTDGDETLQSPEVPNDEPEAEIVSDLNYQEKPEAAPAHFSYPDVQEPPAEEPAVAVVEEPQDEVSAEEPTDAVAKDPQDEAPEEEPAVAVAEEPKDEAPEEESAATVAEEPQDEATEDEPVDTEPDPIEPTEVADEDTDDEENPIWKEIAALAQEASVDVAGNSTEESQYSPPDSIPPIQSAPVVPDEPEPVASAESEDERPWEAVVEAEDEGFSDFVWNDPFEDDDEPAQAPSTDTDISDAKQPDDKEFTPLADNSVGDLGKMDDDLIAAALSEQMAIEDALENAPRLEGRNIANTPVELGGPRSRTPNVEALKSSVRTKSVKLSKEEGEEQVPARRFRRGLSLILLIFVILLAFYALRAQIVEYLPAAEPYLETYAVYVDILRANAEVFAAKAWDLILQGFDWVMAKIND